MLKRSLSLLSLLLVLAACTQPGPAPTLRVSVVPVPGAANVAVTSVVTATFSAEMDASTVDGAFSLTSAGGPVTGVLTYDSAAHNATFTPTAPLAYATKYTATVDGSVRSKAGAKLSGAYSWSFTTVAEQVEKAVTNVTVTAPADSLYVGGQLALDVEVEAQGGADESVTWASSDETVATVDGDGVVTGVGPGSVVITATSVFDSEFDDSVTLTVSVQAAVTSVTVSPPDAELEIGETIGLTAAVEATGGADQSVVWASSDETVATVDGDGVVAAVAAGTATITATSVVTPTAEGTSVVTVLAPAVESVTVTPEEADLILGGASQTLIATVVTVSGASTAVDWSSSDDTVATVDAGGVVTAVATGTATITATSTEDPLVSGSATVNVYEPLTVNHYLPINVAADVGDLNLDLGASGGLAPYTYEFSVTPPAGWPEDYADVPYDDLDEVGELRLPPDGVYIDGGALRGTGDEEDEGYYAFLVEVTDGLGQVNYVFVELRVEAPAP